MAISALQHLLFCPRQCALIHVEQVWSENWFTALGRTEHQKAHTQGSEKKGNVLIARDLSLRSLELGLIGKADVVEFREGIPYPVEYKHGRPKTNRCDEVQLCAQALCLEEMLSVAIPEGALFYERPHRRTVVEFNSDLRELTVQTAQKLHALIQNQITPAAVYEKAKCEHCSLKDICLPDISTHIQQYLLREVQ